MAIGAVIPRMTNFRRCPDIAGRMGQSTASGFMNVSDGYIVESGGSRRNTSSCRRRNDLGSRKIVKRQQVIKMPGDGEPAYLVIKQPEPLGISMKFEMPKPDPIDFIIGRQLGGHAVRPDPMRFITATTMPMPRAPGVDAMLADGWVWAGWRS